MRANISAFGLLCRPKSIILNRLFAQIVDAEPGAEQKPDPPRAEVWPADARQVGVEGAYGPRSTYGGKKSMTERILVRGLAVVRTVGDERRHPLP